MREANRNGKDKDTKISRVPDQVQVGRVGDFVMSRACETHEWDLWEIATRKELGFEMDKNSFILRVIPFIT